MDNRLLDAPRWSNILKLDHEFGAGQAVLQAGPLEAYVEVAARCNLRCQMCPITVDPRYDPLSGRPGLFAPEMFNRLEPFFPTLQRVYLIGLGEPTLHAGLPEFTRRLAEAGVEVWVTTNATLVDDEKAEALALAGLSHVSVSIDGGTRETYERIRVRGKFDDVVRGLKALGRARARHGNPEIWLNVVANASNLPELVPLVELCAEAGGDGIFIEGLYPYAHPAIEEFCRQESLDHLGEERVNELFALAESRANELGIRWMTRLDEQVMNAPKFATEPAPLLPEAASPPQPAPTAMTPAGVEAPLTLPFACSEPWSNMNINASGEVRPCCFNDIVLGDLNRQSIEEIWNGPGYTELRSDMAAGRVPATCATCVRQGRVKRNTFLSLRDPALDTSPSRGFSLELPLEGSLVDGNLVVVGRWKSLLARMRPGSATLPDLYIDDFRAAGLGDWAVIDGSWVTAAMPASYIDTGAHRLSLRFPGAPESESWGHRWLQFGTTGAALTASSRLGIPLWFRHHEPRPELTIGGRRHPIERWLCGPRGEDTWIGVAVVSVESLAPGSYDVEMRFRHQPPWTARLDRLR